LVVESVAAVTPIRRAAPTAAVEGQNADRRRIKV
jgi:hypothetical protein